MDEEELKEFVREEKFVGDEEIDLNYEFDAPRFHDFSRAETDSDAEEAERWFDFAGDYQPSPFIIKLNWRHGISIVNAFAKSKCADDVNANSRGLHNHTTQEISEAKSKCQVKSTVSRSSTLMKPTASHLAKQNQLKLVHSIRLKNKLGNIDDKSSQNSCITDELGTKRQKLETGYSSKEAQLKHKANLLHKVRLDGVTANARPKATIPREPDLETAQRAERRRYKVNAESGEQEKSIASTLKARDANRKIVKASFFLVTRRSKHNDSEFQVAKRCGSLQNKNTKGKSVLLRSNSLRQEKCEKVNNSFEALAPTKKIFSVNEKICCSRNIRQATTTVTRGLILNDKKFQDDPPIDLFNKLCLTSEFQQNIETPQLMEGGKRIKPSFFSRKQGTLKLQG